MAKHTQIILWTAPRCISTAFERSIIEINGTKVLHEPYSNAYYFGPERQINRYTDDAINEEATYRSVTNYIKSIYNDNNVVFIKDMAYHIDNRHNEILTNEFSSTKHTFLIRHPKKAIMSLYKSSTDQDKTGWDHFNPIEAGFNSMKLLYDDIKHCHGYEPVIIDADDLLDNPEYIMEIYCKRVELPYNENMLSWKAGPVPEWNVWKGWHDDAINSTGFTKVDDPKSKELSRLKKETEYISMPDIVKKTIKESMQAYEYLYERRIKLPEN